jgi:hypothetical protein
VNMMASLDEYEQLIAPARERFAESPGIQVISLTSDSVFLELFLLHFCALGSQMTEPVERWIRHAAERCASMGLSDLASGLRGHAQAETGHHLMMIADVRSLAARWNARHKHRIDASQLLNQPPTPGVFHYCSVHEENIAGATPYAQVAIEYEVEILPLRYGERLLNRCVQMLGAEILPCLSFVTEHIVLDIGHTNFNARVISKLIELMPWSMSALVSAGSAALDAYSQFLSDCVQLADRDSRKVQF